MKKYKKLLHQTCLDNRSLCCSCMCLHHRVLSSTCPCLHYRGLCCTLMDVSTPQRPQLHLELPGQQEPVLLLDVSTLQGPEQHFSMSPLHYVASWWTCLHHRGLCSTGRVWTKGACAGLGGVYTTGSWWAAPVHVYATEAYLHLNGHVYTTGASAAPGLAWTRGAFFCSLLCLHSNGLSCTWTYLDYRNLILNLATLLSHVLHLEVPTPHLHLTELHLDVSGQQNPSCTGMDVFTQQGAWAATGRVYTTKTYATPRHVYTTWSWVAPGHVYTTEACIAPGCFYSIRACTGPRLVWTEACVAPGRVNITGGAQLRLDLSIQQRLCCTWTSL